MRFLYLVLAALVSGVVVGRYLGPDFGNAYELVLYLLIFLIGLDLGMNFKMADLKKVGKSALLMPFLTIIGSLLGALVASLVLGVPLKWGLAIGAGCGWYSLTGPLIAQYSVVYGAVGFLANLIREILTILLYPVLAGKIGPRKAVVIGGATTMDTTLPIIARFGGREVALVAFVHGFVLTAVVPFLVPLILSLFDY